LRKGSRPFVCGQKLAARWHNAPATKLLPQRTNYGVLRALGHIVLHETSSLGPYSEPMLLSFDADSRSGAERGDGSPWECVLLSPWFTPRLAVSILLTNIVFALRAFAIFLFNFENLRRLASGQAAISYSRIKGMYHGKWNS
jgi:hypothetical protein